MTSHGFRVPNAVVLSDDCPVLNPSGLKWDGFASVTNGNWEWPLSS